MGHSGAWQVSQRTAKCAASAAFLPKAHSAVASLHPNRAARPLALEKQRRDLACQAASAEASTDAEFEQLMQRDAFAELVKMAVEKDPSLAGHVAGSAAGQPPSLQQLPNQTKPGWLRQRAPQGERFDYLNGQMKSLKLATVCQEAQCPNVGECWNGGSHGIGTATIMLMGDTCTRGCRFCAVSWASNRVQCHLCVLRAGSSSHSGAGERYQVCITVTH